MSPCSLAVAALLLLGFFPRLIQAQAKQSAEGATVQILLILPGGANGGVITAQTTEAELTKMFGNANVVSRDIDLAEGETAPGTELFPDDPLRHAEILWKDSKGKRGPKQVQISGEKSTWSTVHGISLGTTLKKLEELNRGSFRLAGFDFDYSGTVKSWGQGALARELEGPGRVIVACTPQAITRNRSRIRSSEMGFFLPVNLQCKN